MMLKNTYIDFRIIAKALGAMIMIVGISMLIPTVVAFAYRGTDRFPLLISALFSLFVGFGLRNGIGCRNSIQMPMMNKREGYIIVTFSWVAMSLFGAIPFIIDKNISTYSDAFLETISGFTTTGITVLDDIEALPKGLLLWRCMTQWIGGIGIIMFGLAILPLLGISGGNDLFAAEFTGPTKDKLRPKITETAKIIILIYICLTFLETIFLAFGEMDLFDAVCHSFTTIATGGFSTKNASLMNYGVYTQYVVTAFMMLSGINFGLYFFAITGRFQQISKNSELKSYVGLVLFSIVFLSIILLTTSSNTTIEEAFRNSAFTSIAFITTTGFVNTDYASWLPATTLFLFILLFTGACAGSTSGGIKMARHTLLIKNMSIEFKRLVHPRAVIPVKYNGQAISSEVIFKVLAFFFLYIVIVMFGALVFSILGYDTVSATVISASALGNQGISVGEMSVNFSYAAMPIFGKCLLCLFMVIGRLELFTVLTLFTLPFWKK